MLSTRLFLMLALIVGCDDPADREADAGSPPDQPNGSAAGSAATAVDLDPEDPCRTLTRAEAEQLVGPLRAEPWRSGAVCHFAAADGQRLDVEVQWSAARAVAELTGVAERQMTKGLIIETARGLDTLEGRWDDAQWKLGSYLVARQGDRSVTVYLANLLRPDPTDAAVLADLALGRLDQPLTYQGSAHREPPPLVTPVDPCGLLTREEVEAAAGPLAGEPSSGDEGTCTWPLVSRRGKARDFWYTVTWENGTEAFNQDLAALGLYRANLEIPVLTGTEGGAAQAPVEALRTNPAAEGLRALAGLIGDGGHGRREGADQVPLMPKSDPDVPGPWQRAALLAGSDFVAVQKGVRIRAGISAAGFDATRALMEKMVGRLR